MSKRKNLGSRQFKTSFSQAEHNARELKTSSLFTLRLVHKSLDVLNRRKCLWHLAN